jgi:hypothetical protein
LFRIISSVFGRLTRTSEGDSPFARQDLLNGIGALVQRHGSSASIGVFGVTCFASCGSASGVSAQLNVTWDGQAFGETTVEAGIKFIQALKL